MAFRSSADTISRVTDAVLADVEAWRIRPLEAVYNPRLGISRPVRRSA